jgi:thymidine phosphorylase
MPGVEKARELAEAMVKLGNECGVNTCALLTSMNAPLGRSAGNWLEIRETVLCLEDKGPADLRELVLACASQLLLQTSRAGSLIEAHKQAEACLASGGPRRKWDEMVVAQGGLLDAFNRKLALEHTAPAVSELRSPGTGFVSCCDARLIGEVIRDLGGGRLLKESGINHDVGVDLLAKPGDRVVTGGLLVRIHAQKGSEAETARVRLQDAFEIAEKEPSSTSLIAEVVSPSPRLS